MSIPVIASLLLLLLLAASSSSPAAAARPGGGPYTHIRFYMHETVSGRDATLLRSVQSPLGGDSMFGSVNVLDNELRDGPDRSCSRLLARLQGLFVGAGLVSPPGLMSSLNVVFTAGKLRGSTLALLGPVLDFEAPVERALVGGTGVFRMARGYSIMTSVGNYTMSGAVVLVDRIDLFVKIPRWATIMESLEEDSSSESLFED
ncbi:dirigent protein 21 [Brachypodium distachyon]|uniref:Dirigent protein n=1 Tax=Brachypodium distachyon TaxID=15368 RepID=I1GS68_BRADI|nr:dirigent protein 21 [Brachypodium distachyon]KQK15142.1 hypothetical protein BRADI_1g20950v3 [Brachypodium distachyon]|eukprot:XP_003559941.2 dirigent protein 21 [Brachypodium distachyon]